MLSLCGYTQSKYKCNGNLVRIADQNADNLTEDICLDFLLTIDTICKNNAEFGQYSNETLFKLLESNPLMLIRTHDKNKSKIDSNLILYMIKTPIHDGFDLIGISKRIQELECESGFKEDILMALNYAISKANKYK